MNEQQKMELKPGDRIRLTGNASAWTQGYIFDVIALKSWGVVCTAEIQDKPGLRGYVAPYRATWDQIEERV